MLPHRRIVAIWSAIVLGVIVLFAPLTAGAAVTGLKQGIAEAAARDPDVAGFYRDTGFATLWVGPSARESDRRAALIRALSTAEDHALPVARYDVDGLLARMGATRTHRDLGQLDVALTRAFLAYARDVQTGILRPAQVDSLIKRDVPELDRVALLHRLAASDTPREILRALPPQSPEYLALMKAKLGMEHRLAEGGWGADVPDRKLEPGDRGAGVAALRDRLIAMGYLERTNTVVYDAALTEAVTRFQADHGLLTDGIAGSGTLAEINVDLATRLASVVVAMERERWSVQDKGDRHILVNIPDFRAEIVDHGKVTFATRAVVGARDRDRATPEFSDVMEFMVVNPSWYVPRSIATKEYLPQLQADPLAVQHLVITDVRGQQIDRTAIDFTQFSTRNFPFDMRQPPSRSNALGLVKFMFPNANNIYLHDTPHKNLFGREVRAYSHGCIRLADPFDFAYALLAAQSPDPVRLFQSTLATGQETNINLVDPVPVHLIYRTAFATPHGTIAHRRDIYGRDARIWSALQDAGVALRDVQG